MGTEMHFGIWVLENRPTLNGRGTSGAWEAGAGDALKGDYNVIYERSDCIYAYIAGYRKMTAYLGSGGVIICDCCGSRIRRE